MDWNALFANPRFSMVANQILEFLDYDGVKTCRDVSPIWKKYIDEQRSWRLRYVLSFLEPKPVSDSVVRARAKKGHFKGKKKTKAITVPPKSQIVKKFPEWNKILPFVKTEMCVFDLDVLIDGLQFYNKREYTCQEYSDYYDDGDVVMLDKWCPLDLAIYCGNHKFVEVMIRTPFDFNTISFTFYEGYRYPSPCNRCGELCSGCFYMEVDLADEHFLTHGNNVLHTAARKGHLEIVKIILENARVKNIDINALNGREQNAIQVAKDDPEVVKILMKQCKYDEKTIESMGIDRLKTIATMAKYWLTDGKVSNDGPTKKKRKTAKK